MNISGILRIAAITAAVLVLACSLIYSESYAETSYITKKGFPKSYRTRLKELHKLHPSWRFTPVKTGLDWKDAVKAMTKDPGVNTIWYAYTPAYKSVAEGRYNYLTDKYTGGNFPAASAKAVRYFMDPRNFLTERNIFLFEDKKYHSYQRLSMVKKILRRNDVLKANASVFVKAGKKHDVSPVYLASKSFSELGTSDFMMNGHKFKYKGIKYSKCYNAYNIGATDSAGAVGGLIYANGGKSGKNYTAGPETSYGRKWSTPAKAIKGGAKFLARAYIKNNQATAYTEHFNVLNGLGKVGTHVYMTSLNGGISIAGQMSEKYADYGIYNRKLQFFIPVYKNMPKKPCGRPSASSKKDNNFYLKALTVKYTDNTGDEPKTVRKKLIRKTKLSYRTSFTYSVPSYVKKVSILASKASDTNASVTGTGVVKLEKGENVFKIKCKASAGPARTYTIKIIRG